MSMTQAVFVDKSTVPTLAEIEKTILNLGFKFEIKNKQDNILSESGIDCLINGYDTYFETYVEEPSVITNELEFIKSDLTTEDVVILFVWSVDAAAGACIGLISIALIDHCNAKVYYLDDETKYVRQMLLDDTQLFLKELS